MPTLLELKSKQQEALDRADAALKAGEASGRAMTPAEVEQYHLGMADFSAIASQIAAGNRDRTLQVFGPDGKINPAFLGGRMEPPPPNAFGARPLDPRTRTGEYAADFQRFLTSKGQLRSDTLLAGFDGLDGYVIPGSDRWTRQRAANGQPVMSAALYEGVGGGSTTAGGDLISVPTAQEMLVPLGLPDLGIFNASTVIGTASDIKVPVHAAFGGSALKSESGSSTNVFAETDPTLSQFTLSAWMIGNQRTVSWELLQDAPVFQSFTTSDLLAAQQIYEGSLYVNGSGSSQPQGLLGNTGTGTGSAYELVGTASTDAQTLLNALYDVQGTLKERYAANASFVMSRATAMSIRKAQTQTNLFIPVVRVAADGTTLVLDRPVFFDTNMPALPTATSSGVVPILYGDFAAGYLIGVRGGGGINVKILDQPLATSGQLILLAYRRVDGRVRRSEAIQQIQISHS
jgi:HK97 family phage major capsid protein